jgi:Viral BACON domain
MVATLFVCPQPIRRILANQLVHSMGLRLVFLFLPLLAGCGDAGTSQFNDLAAVKVSHERQNVYGSTINVSPASFAFSVTQGDLNPVHMVNVSNAGKGQLNWSMSTTASWLTVSPSTGIASGHASDTVTATADFSGLAPGTYSATITVFGVGATNNGQDIPVTLTIAAAASLPSESTITSTSSTSTSTPPTSPPTTTPLPSSSPTAFASLAWNAESDPFVLGYYVHYGTQSPNSVGSCAYEQSIYYSLSSLGNATTPTATISGLGTGATYYFAVSAYNGVESPCSTEVSKAT